MNSFLIRYLELHSFYESFTPDDDFSLSFLSYTFTSLPEFTVFNFYWESLKRNYCCYNCYSGFSLIFKVSSLILITSFCRFCLFWSYSIILSSFIRFYKYSLKLLVLVVLAIFFFLFYYN